MFADACQKAVRYTRPIAISTRRHDGTLQTDVASMIIVNSNGWAITAGHVFDSFVKFQGDDKKMKEVEQINLQRQQKAGSPSPEIKIDGSLITNHSFWWAWDGARFNNVYVNRQIDIAIGRIDNFDPSWVKEYPVFADPDKMRVGTSLCRGGYPFINIKPDFNLQTMTFAIPKITEKEFYPTDGMLGHLTYRGKSIDGGYDMHYIETSTPGIKGQSGGPIFDSKGLVYGMQTLTEHRELGFHPTAELDGQKYIENQFMNIGVGLSTKTLIEIFRSKNVRFDMEGDESGFRIIE